jgi:hypothetical protein
MLSQVKQFSGSIVNKISNVHIEKGWQPIQ